MTLSSIQQSFWTKSWYKNWQKWRSEGCNLMDFYESIWNHHKYRNYRLPPTPAWNLAISKSSHDFGWGVCIYFLSTVSNAYGLFKKKIIHSAFIAFTINPIVKGKTKSIQKQAVYHCRLKRKIQINKAQQELHTPSWSSCM